MKELANRKSLIWILPAVVVIGLVLAILIPVGGTTDTVTEVVARWFFAVFCTLYVIVQGRMYLKFRQRRKVGGSTGVPIGAHAAFTIIWLVLAVAAIVYAVLDLAGWYETAGWIILALLICAQMLLLGRLDRRVKG